MIDLDMDLSMRQAALFNDEATALRSDSLRHSR